MNQELKKKLKEKYESAIKAHENILWEVNQMHEERIKKINEELEILKIQMDSIK